MNRSGFAHVVGWSRLQFTQGLEFYITPTIGRQRPIVRSVLSLMERIGQTNWTVSNFWLRIHSLCRMFLPKPVWRNKSECHTRHGLVQFT